jgi:TP53 regulating kinase-like protein
MKKIIAQGAEALLIRYDDKLIKRRIKKNYRHTLLDEQLRKKRTRSEAKLIKKASDLINVPKIIEIDEKKKEIIMDFIPGKRLSEWLDQFKLRESLKICKGIGKSIAALHDADIIHGDLTTSNIILHQGKIYFIDFGLGFHSNRIEDKAVDLHLLRQAFESKHFKRWEKYFNSTISGYKTSKNSENVLKQLEKVEARGRYKGKH